MYFEEYRFFSSLNTRTSPPSKTNHPLMLFGFVNPYGILDDPLPYVQHRFISVKHVTKLLQLRSQELSFLENIPLFSNVQQLVVSQVLSRSLIILCLGSYS